MIFTKENLAYFSQRFKVDGETGCWLWTGSTVNGKYGCANINYKQYLAHRLSYELHHGPIPDGLNVCHHCDVPLCVNPEHLFLGTQKENLKDMTNKGRRAIGEAVASFSGRVHSSATKRLMSKIRQKWWAENN